MLRSFRFAATRGSAAIVLSAACLLLAGCGGDNGQADKNALAQPDAAQQRPAQTASETTASDTAEIIWDAYGVPHIYAETDEAGFHGFGWAQMEARANLVLELFARGRGEYAAIAGEDAIEADMLVHTFDIADHARKWRAALSEETRARLDAYIAGMNAWAEANPDRIKPELQGVLPIRAVDPLAHSYNNVHLNFMTHDAFQRIPIADEPPGSNAMAIGPSRSASGNAMLVVNPHLPWGDIYTWTEVHLSMPSFEIYGVAMTGSPIVGIGFTEHGGWTHTVNHFDGVDLYEITPSGDGYMFDGAERAFDTKTVRLNVRQADGELDEYTREIRETVHGPVLFGDDETPIAVRIAAWDSYGLIDQYIDMAAAETFEKFEEAQSRLQVPFFNTIYANADGDIYYFHGGRVPVRGRGDWHTWREVVPGDSSDWLWTEYHGYEDMPHIANPESGFVQNANEPPWYSTWPRELDPADYVPYMAPDYAIGFRPQRSLAMLLGDTSITFNELVEMKQANTLGMAERFAEQLIGAAKNASDADARAGARVLADWNLKADPDSRGAILFMEWADRVFAAAENGDPVYSTDDWRENVLTTPARFDDAEAAVRHLADAVRHVRKTYGDPAVPYGEVYRLKMGALDLPGSGASGRYGAYRVTNAAETETGRRVVRQGDSFVAVVEFGETLKAVGNLSYGNVEDESDPAFGAGIPLFSESRLRPILFTEKDVREAGVRTETVTMK